jgi:hypothetical protein
VSELLERAAESVAPDGTVIAAALPAVASALEDLYDSDALVSEVEDLCLFAVWLKEEKRAPAACEALLRVAERALPALRQIAGRGADVADSVQSRNFASFKPDKTPKKPELAPPKTGRPKRRS